MKTKKEVITENSEFRLLINAVINNIGLGSVQDVNNYGISGGFSGFIYYYDTHKFAMRYRKQIIALLEQESEMFGQSVFDFVKSFRCLDFDSEEQNNFYRYMGGNRLEQCQLTNTLAWYAAETVCRWFEN